MLDRHVRLLRAAVVTVVVLALSAGAHLSGGGNLPHPNIFAGIAAVAMLAATIIARRRLKLPVLVAVLGAGQIALHHAFGVLTTSAVCTPAATHPGHSATMICTGGSMDSHQHVLDDGMSLPMFAAHVLATLAAAVVIARGEQALYAAGAWLRPLLRSLRVSAAHPPALVSPITPGRRPHTVPFLASPPLRGPPAFH